MKRRTIDRLILAMLLAAPACQTVKPYQREHLTRPGMIDTDSPGEQRFDQHARGSREGADGGTGKAGGGCGCN